jgi:hypothetical protein
MAALAIPICGLGISCFLLSFAKLFSDITFSIIDIAALMVLVISIGLFIIVESKLVFGYLKTQSVSPRMWQGPQAKERGTSTSSSAVIAAIDDQPRPDPAGTATEYSSASTIIASRLALGSELARPLAESGEIRAPRREGSNAE